MAGSVYPDSQNQVLADSTSLNHYAPFPMV